MFTEIAEKKYFNSCFYMKHVACKLNSFVSFFCGTGNNNTLPYALINSVQYLKIIENLIAFAMYICLAIFDVYEIIFCLSLELQVILLVRNMNRFTFRKSRISLYLT